MNAVRLPPSASSNTPSSSLRWLLGTLMIWKTVDDVSKRDLSYTQPLGTRWDAVQVAAQNWVSNTGAMHNNALTA